MGFTSKELKEKYWRVILNNEIFQSTEVMKEFFKLYLRYITEVNLFFHLEIRGTD